MSIYHVVEDDQGGRWGKYEALPQLSTLETRHESCRAAIFMMSRRQMWETSIIDIRPNLFHSCGSSSLIDQLLSIKAEINLEKSARLRLIATSSSCSQDKRRSQQEAFASSRQADSRCQSSGSDMCLVSTIYSCLTIELTPYRALLHASSLRTETLPA